jgi:hypothetical protein
MNTLERIFVYNAAIKTYLYDYLDNMSLLTLCQVNKVYNQRSIFVYNLIFTKVSLSLKPFLDTLHSKYLIYYCEHELKRMMKLHYESMIMNEIYSFDKENFNEEEAMNRHDIRILLKNKTLRKYFRKYALNYIKNGLLFNNIKN